MMEIRKVSMKDFSSLRMGGEGNMITTNSMERLKDILMHAKAEGFRVHVLGAGTNTYFGEDLSDFLFITLALSGKTIKQLDVDTVLLTVSASENWDDVVKFAVEQNLWGIENLSYIPGTVGAAPVQNIGAYGVELADTFVSLQAFDTTTQEVIELSREACTFGYRDSLFKHEKGRYIILSMTLRLFTQPHPILFYKPLDMLQGKEVRIQDVRALVVATRTTKLPDWHDHPNAGSFFKNPVVDLETYERLKHTYSDMPTLQISEGYKIPAAWLIEHVAHMKGLRVGDVGTWSQQPLVLVQYGNATADDLDTFAQQIRKNIYEKTGISLEQEVNRVG